MNYKIKEIKKSEKEFPRILKKTKKCPEKLYYRGEWDAGLFEKSLAIVGSRKMTRYGREVINRFMPTLVAEGVTIISGFMYGVDCEAHRQCVELGGKTVAVLGWGLDYESGDMRLYKKILESGGLIISEYEKDFKATRWSFPQRNRIVSGLAGLGVLVVEAGERSGSLITAKMAHDEKRAVGAVPGPINGAVSRGTNWLIKEGLAKMIIEAENIWDKEGKEAVQESLFVSDLGKTEKKIIEILSREATGVDGLVRELNLTVVEVLGKISLLSMKNVIEEEGGKIYLKK